jgi:hypothetical protein
MLQGGVEQFTLPNRVRRTLALAALDSAPQPSSHSHRSRISINVRPHVELTMAPHVGFNTDQIKDKARKDLLYLLEGVSKGSHSL